MTDSESETVGGTLTKNDVLIGTAALAALVALFGATMDWATVIYSREIVVYPGIDGDGKGVVGLALVAFSTLVLFFAFRWKGWAIAALIVGAVLIVLASINLAAPERVTDLGPDADVVALADRGLYLVFAASVLFTVTVCAATVQEWFDTAD